jgi:molybdopterin biosynthesis enzyme MoaB
MTPGKITTELVYTVKVTLVSDERSIAEDTARTKTGPVMQEWLKNKLFGVVHEGDTFDVEVIPRSRIAYDLRGSQ